MSKGYVKGWKGVTRVWDVGLRDFWDAITVYKVNIDWVSQSMNVVLLPSP